jgi:ATP-dependent Clp protease ATP-binding subunit ClpA
VSLATTIAPALLLATWPAIAGADSEPTGNAAASATSAITAPAATGEGSGSTGLRARLASWYGRLRPAGRSITEQLSQRVIGQEEAVTAVGSRLDAARAGLVDRAGPAGTFLFVGPPETGKTTMAHAIAELYHGSPGRLVRLDLSRYDGSPLAGDSGVQIASRLESDLDALIGWDTGKVLLLDNFEQAAPPTYSVLESVLRGELPGRRPRRLRDTVIVVRSSVMPSPQQTPLGFRLPEETPEETRVATDPLAPLRAAVVNHVQRIPHKLRPTLTVVPFAPLAPQAAADLMVRQLSQLGKRLQKRGLELAVSTEGMSQVFRDGYRPAGGASAMRESLDRHLTQPLASALQGEKIPAGSRVLFHCADGQCLIAAEKRPHPLLGRMPKLAPGQWPGRLHQAATQLVRRTGALHATAAAGLRARVASMLPGRPPGRRPGSPGK